MILLVVYVGAVAVLFLFVVMMLDVDFSELKRGALQYAPVGALVGLILLGELIVVFAGSMFTPCWGRARFRSRISQNAPTLQPSVTFFTPTTFSTSRLPDWSFSLP